MLRKAFPTQSLQKKLTWLIAFSWILVIRAYRKTSSLMEICRYMMLQQATTESLQFLRQKTHKNHKMKFRLVLHGYSTYSSTRNNASIDQESWEHGGVKLDNCIAIPNHNLDTNRNTLLDIMHFSCHMNTS